MHWGIETCRSVLIHSRIKYIVLFWLYVVNVCKMHDTQFQKQKLQHLSWTPFIMERVLIDKWQLLCLSRNSWSFMKSSVSLQWTQDCRCTVSWGSWIESTPSRCFLKNHFNILFLSVPLSPYMSLLFRIPPKMCLLYL